MHVNFCRNGSQSKLNQAQSASLCRCHCGPGSAGPAVVVVLAYMRPVRCGG